MRKILRNFRLNCRWVCLIALTTPTLLSAAGAALVTVPKTLSAEPCMERSYPDDFTSSTAKLTGSFGSWSVIVDKNPRQCWLMAKPTDTEIREQKIKPKYCRNDPYLMINFIPRSIQSWTSLNGCKPQTFTLILIKFSDKFLYIFFNITS